MPVSAVTKVEDKHVNEEKYELNGVSVGPQEVKRLHRFVDYYTLRIQSLDQQIATVLQQDAGKAFPCIWRNHFFAATLTQEKFAGIILLKPQ